MAYIDSNKIKIFPSVKRGIEYPSARITTEEAFTNIVNKLIDTEGFVITPTFMTDKPFEMNINGYYIRVEKGQDILDKFTSGLDTATKIYAGIIMETVGDNIELKNQDFNGEYQGVEFNLNTPLTTWSYGIPILVKSSGVWYSDISSLVKFGNESLNLVVDGGTI